ncbi:peptidase M14 [Halalkalibacillus sediminis]|uniref:Peptidase M14 n=1 Tax=Halalkalibacillus sediminis TaxID=2018042 RepID=A0A2I0QXF4_9BACI|nr:M14 family zinc carboxypeptidase [Halalkalibacillus sediminis]PKR78790.1 peptidase M14 [Halalkalibacillus sediminis]
MIIKIQPGTTMYNIAVAFQLPLGIVIASNPNKDPNNLSIGDTLQIPGYQADTRLINAGDTYWSISQQENTDINQLRLANQYSPENLPIGRNLNIPKMVRGTIVQTDRIYSSSLMEEHLKELVEVYPFLDLRVIGQSVMGKPIYEVRVGSGSKLVHVNGSFHANEAITTSVIMKFIEEYAEAITTNEPIRGNNMMNYFENVTLSLVPMVNPDGVDLLAEGVPSEQEYRDLALEINNNSTDFSGWKANIRGVDLNNQYPANWQIEQNRKPKQPSPRDFPGNAPLTEPEAIAMAELVGRENFDRVLALHTQGQVIFWGYEGLEPPESQEIVSEYSRVSSFAPIRYVDSHAGFKDWFIQEFRLPGFTVELGKGVNPLPFNQFDEMYEQMLGIFLANSYI